MTVYFWSFISIFLLDLNAQNKQGNTPLHVAVKAQQTSSIDFLIEHGADTAVRNDDALAPIHLAVELNAVSSLKVVTVHFHIHCTCIISYLLFITYKSAAYDFESMYKK